MRIAFLADIHANLPALEAVIADAKARGVTHVVCLGDIVGYGPQPAETLQRVRQIASATVMGNHDAAVCGLLNPNLFNAFARETAERAMLALSHGDREWLKALPYILEGDGFACAHGGFVNPEAFNYLETKQDALHCLTAMPDFPLLVVGHTHIPCLFVQDAPGQPVRKLPPEDITLRPGMRIIANPGSVGFPRTDTLSANYLVFDTQTRRITFAACVYDLAPYRLALVRNGYNPMNYWFLSPSARKRQTEQAYLNPVRVAEAPLGAAAPFRPKRRKGFLTLPGSFWVLVLLFFSLALVSLCVLGPVLLEDYTPQQEVSPVAVQEPNLLPPFALWEKASAETIDRAPISGSLLELTPAKGPAHLSLKSPLVPVPPGESRLRLRFAVEAVRAQYTARVTFILSDGTQRLDREHPYKRPGEQRYTVKVPEGAVRLRVHLDLALETKTQVSLPELTPVR